MTKESGWDPDPPRSVHPLEVAGLASGRRSAGPSARPTATKMRAPSRGSAARRRVECRRRRRTPPKAIVMTMFMVIMIGIVVTNVDTIRPRVRLLLGRGDDLPAVRPPLSGQSNDRRLKRLVRSPVAGGPNSGRLPVPMAKGGVQRSPLLDVPFCRVVAIDVLTEQLDAHPLILAAGRSGRFNVTSQPPWSMPRAGLAFESAASLPCASPRSARSASSARRRSAPARLLRCALRQVVQGLEDLLFGLPAGAVVLSHDEFVDVHRHEVQAKFSGWRAAPGAWEMDSPRRRLRSSSAVTPCGNRCPRASILKRKGSRSMNRRPTARRGSSGVARRDRRRSVCASFGPAS
jgi:hypothetical protein